MIKNNKLVACYTVFNGEELLEKSMQTIDSQVDLFVICFQTMSNKGQENPNLKAFMGRFVGNTKVILVGFTPNLAVNTKANERVKHQIMLETARNNGGTHVLLAACDHFYERHQFEFAKELTYANDLDIGFTRMYTFYKHPTWQITPMEEYYMPFIIKLSEGTRITSTEKGPVLVDPSVKVTTMNKYTVFTVNECVLYHYSMIRLDIKSKFSNAAASIRWTKEQTEQFIREYEGYDLEKNEGLIYFQGRKVKLVSNYFNL